MTPQTPKERRRKRFVHRNVQGRVLISVAFYWILYHAFLWHALFLAKGILGHSAATLGERYREFFSEYCLLLICALLVFPMVMADMIKLTHRIVGPFTSFERVLDNMAKGQAVPHLTLRKKDLVGDLATAINKVIDYHNARLRHDGKAFPATKQTSVAHPAVGLASRRVIAPRTSVMTVSMPTSRLRSPSTAIRASR